MSVSRPLFYVPQGLLWRYVSEDEWLGRSLSAAFAVMLIVCIWFLARRLAEDRASRALLPPLAVIAALSSRFGEDRCAGPDRRERRSEPRR